MDKTYIEAYKSLGLNIAFYRHKRNLTQSHLAELIDIDRSHMSEIELGKIGVSLDVIFRICKHLDITPGELFNFR